MRRLLPIVAAVAVVGAACAGPSVLVAGESVRPPETPPDVVPFVVLAGDDLTPLAAEVVVNGETMHTDGSGGLAVMWKEEWANGIAVEIDVPGFHSTTLDVPRVPDDVPVEVRLDPVVLTGSVVTEAGSPLPGVEVSLNGTSVVTGAGGQFRFQRARPGDLTVWRPAWTRSSTPWDGTEPAVELVMAPRIEKAIRVTAAVAGDPSAWSRLVRLADTTEISAFVLDVKDESGLVPVSTLVESAHEAGAASTTYDVDAALREMADHDIYAVARISVFADDRAASRWPAMAVGSATGDVWRNGQGLAYLDPSDPASWVYPIDLAVEACQRGFDEIQFDDVGFPIGGQITGSAVFDGVLTADYFSSEEAQTARVDAIVGFLGAARSELNPRGCAVAVRPRSITFHSDTYDEGIGQRPEALAAVVDVISPTIFAYDYDASFVGGSEPNTVADRIVADVLDAGLRLVPDTTVIRPWLQRAFLGPEMILAEQGVAEERGLGWMLWSPTSSYDRSFLETTA